MKIKSLGWSTFQLTVGDTTLVTDPLSLKDSGFSFNKMKCDVVIFSEKELFGKEDILKEKGLEKKVEPDHRDTIIEISSPGEFEVGGLMIRRDVDSPFYIIDEGKLRVVYMGLVDNSLDVGTTKDLGDVDVLILPIGNGSLFPDYDRIEKVIRNVDPTILLPSAYKKNGLKIGSDMKSREDFIKFFGFTNVRDESYLNVVPVAESENKNMEVIFLN
ncbi:MAG: MBL fold metallo-hydrolase [Candidatus Dojkabacteria bacterium]